MIRDTDYEPFSHYQVNLVMAVVQQIQTVFGELQKLKEDKFLLNAVNTIEPLIPQLIYIRSEGAYVELIFDLSEANNKVVRVSLSKLADWFEKSLLKIHRKFLINPTRVDKVIRSGRDFKIRITDSSRDKIELPLGRSYVTKVKKALPGMVEYR